MNAENIRFGWMEGAIRYAGLFGAHEKRAYVETFGISEAAVSRHQLRFASAFEDACGAEVFERTNRGTLQGGKLSLREGADIPERHIFAVPGIDRWLEDAMRVRFERVEVIARAAPESHILRAMIGAIRENKVMEIEYLSRSRGTRRLLSPHTLVSVVGRYHIRAFDHAKNRYGDFVLSRIISAHPATSERTTYVGLDLDKEWQDKILIVIESRDEQYSEGVRRDFGLDPSGRRKVRVRQAIASYLCDDPDEGYESPVRTYLNNTKM